MSNCVTTTTAAGIQLRTSTDNKASSEGRLRIVADGLDLPDKPDKEEVAEESQRFLTVGCGSV